MLKRVERKRKRREEDEESGLDKGTKETLGLDDTDSDGPDSDSDSDSGHSDVGTGEDDPDEDASPMSVAEALKDPMYLVSLNPTVHGCVLCRGKLIKNSGMATAHRNASAHKRRFESFRLLSADAAPHSNAWELVRAIRSPAFNAQTLESQEPSKRALKRQAKQAAIRERRKRHKDLKAAAIAKKAVNKLSLADKTRHAAPLRVELRKPPESHIPSRDARKKERLKSSTPASAVTKAGNVANVTAASASRIETSRGSKKPVPNPRLEGVRKAR